MKLKPRSSGINVTFAMATPMEAAAEEPAAASPDSLFPVALPTMTLSPPLILGNGSATKASLPTSPSSKTPSNTRIKWWNHNQQQQKKKIRTRRGRDLILPLLHAQPTILMPPPGRLTFHPGIVRLLTPPNPPPKTISSIPMAIATISPSDSLAGLAQTAQVGLKILRFVKFPDSILENLRRVHGIITTTESSPSNFSFEFLLGSSNDISMRTEMMKFIRNATFLCLTTFPHDYILEESVLVAEELLNIKMDSCSCSVTPCRPLAKSLVKSNRQDVKLCEV